MKKLLAVVTLVVIGLLSSSPSAMADEAGRPPLDATVAEEIFAEFDAAEDPQAAFDGMPLVRQDLAAEALRAVEVRDTVTQESAPQGTTRATVRSKTVTFERAGYNLLGMKLWAYVLVVNWSYDGNKIVSSSRNRYGMVYFPFWQCVSATTGSSQSGGPGKSSYRAWSQGTFALCLVPTVGCIQYKYPWVEITVNGNGTFYSRSDE